MFLLVMEYFYVNAFVLLLKFKYLSTSFSPQNKLFGSKMFFNIKILKYIDSYIDSFSVFVI